MEKLELELHPEKTKLVNMWDGKEGFNFLGFTIDERKQKLQKDKYLMKHTNFHHKKLCRK